MKDIRDYKVETICEFNRSADSYDNHSPFYYRLTRLCDDAVISQIAALDNPKANILDVGCGTGALLEKIRQKFSDAALSGVDIAPNMLDKANCRCIPNAFFTEGDAENLPFKDSTFDAVICCSSFHHYPNPQTAVSEFRRVTKLGGKLILCDMDLPDIARVFANHVLFPWQKKGDVRVYAQNEIRHLLIKYGWYQCSIEKVSPFQWMAAAKARFWSQKNL